ncbi:MAG: CrcB family protein, partial [Peptostreptococcaceae bacterium]|nr:CrcB family protein [Peptostreptococcaceae bacterium]
LGAYTTFSTFMYEGFNLFKEDEKKNAVTYIIGTFIIGIIGFIIGIEIVKYSGF